MEEKLYKVEEVAEILQQTEGYVYELIKYGLLPALQFKSKRVRARSLSRFLDKYEGVNLKDIKAYAESHSHLDEVDVNSDTINLSGEQLLKECGL